MLLKSRRVYFSPERGTVSKSQILIAKLELLSLFALLASANIGTGLFSQSEVIRFESIPGDPSQTSIRAITQDERGFLWLGTSSGLIRYDGYQARIFQNHPSDSTSLSDNPVNAICQATWNGSRELWIGTSNGLNRFDREQEVFVRYQHDPNNPLSLSHNSVNVLLEDRRGTLWIGTIGGGLCRVNNAESSPADNQSPATFVRYVHDPNDPTSISSNTVLAISEHSDGSLWIGASGGGLNRFSPDKGTFIRYPLDSFTAGGLPVRKVSAILASRDGLELWLGAVHDGGLFRIALQRDRNNRDEAHLTDFAAVEEIGLMSVSTIHEDRQGTVWIATPGRGLLQVVGTDSAASNDQPGGNAAQGQTKLTAHRHNPTDPNSLNDNHVLSIFEDRSGINWIGTTRGLQKLSYSSDRFTHIKYEPGHPNTLAANMVTSIWLDRYGWLWLGTSNGLNAYDPIQRRFLLFKHDPATLSSLRKNYIGTLYEDRSNNLWVGTFGGGLARLDLDSFHRTGEARFEHYVRDRDDPNSLEGNFVYSIHEDRLGNLWVGGHALSKLSRGDRAQARFTVFRNNPEDPASVPAGGIMSILEGKNGNIWIGVEGLAKLDPDSGQFTHFKHDSHNPSSLSNNNVGPIYEDASGYLWIGTDSGLNKFDPRTETFSSYFQEDGLPDNGISGILGDDNGNLWLSFGNGLCRFNENLSKGSRFRYYDMNNDLQGISPYFMSYHKSRDGEMFFGGNKGLTRFYPAQIKDNLHVPPVVVTDFKLFNEPVTVGGDSPLRKSITETKALILSHKDTFFSFEFASLDFTAPQKNQYRYMMEGFDDDWIDIGNRRYANYTNLDPGQYTFRVQGSNNDGLRNEEGTSIKITIKPPFWQTWWFRTLIAGLVLLMAYGAHKLRLARLLEIERLRLRIASDLHDDIGAGLTHIGLLSEVALQKSGINQLTAGDKHAQTGAASELGESMARVGAIARELSAAMSDVVWSINPQHDFVEALLHRLTAFAHEICKAKGIALKTEVSEQIAKLRLHSEIRRNLLLIAKEALHNVAKYSESASVALRIDANGKEIILIVEDQGVGFDEADPNRGNGIANMRSRAEKLMGKFEITSEIGHGTRVIATIPYKS